MAGGIHLSKLATEEKMATILKTDIFKGTWLDKPGVLTTHHLDGKRDGLRIVVSEIEGEPVTVKLLKGDGRFSDDRFRKLKSVVVAPKSQLLLPSLLHPFDRLSALLRRFTAVIFDFGLRVHVVFVWK